MNSKKRKRERLVELRKAEVPVFDFGGQVDIVKFFNVLHFVTIVDIIQ